MQPQKIASVLFLLLGFAGAASANTLYGTAPAAKITHSSATLYGVARSTVGTSGETFHWGETTEYEYNAPALPVDDKGGLSRRIFGLKCGTTYHFKLTGTPAPHGRTVQGLDLVFTTLPCKGAMVIGFSGTFAPVNWTLGESPIDNLIDMEDAPRHITLKNSSKSRISGSDVRFEAAPEDGKVIFRYALEGATPACPGTYAINDVPQLLNLKGGWHSFRVKKGDSFSFMLNGGSSPSHFGCLSNGREVEMTISGFIFVPDEIVGSHLQLALAP